jgi:hypothetical protein
MGLLPPSPSGVFPEVTCPHRFTVFFWLHFFVMYVVWNLDCMSRMPHLYYFIDLKLKPLNTTAERNFLKAKVAGHALWLSGHLVQFGFTTNGRWFVDFSKNHQFQVLLQTFKESSIFMKDQLVLCWFFSNFLTLKMFAGSDLEVWITNKHYFQGWSQGWVCNNLTSLGCMHT